MKQTLLEITQDILPSKTSLYQRAYVERIGRDKRREQVRRSSLKRKYDITLEDYNRMFEDQEGCCAICSIKASDLEENLCVDHHHVSGRVRGLLCRTCNRAIGLLKDDPEIIRKAAEYLS